MSLITIKNRTLRITGCLVLLSSIVVFIATWLQWYISIPATVLLGIAAFAFIKNLKDDDDVLIIPTRTILTICLIVLAWVLMSGVGGAFPQKNDMHWRNAIFHDLINYSWPVRYSDGFDSSLTYYIGFWIIPAQIGKFASLLAGEQAGWVAANIATSIYCFVIILLVVLLLMTYFKISSIGKVILVLTVLIFFSGIDVFPYLISQTGQPNISLGTHLEWWTYIQYSSNTTQLSWVYNQAIPAWLVMALILHERKMQHFAFLGLLLLPFAPLPLIGLVYLLIVYLLWMISIAAREKRLAEIISEIASLPNIIATIVVFPIYYFYYHSNATASGVGFGLNIFHLASYVEFVLIEFVLIVILIWRNSYKKPYFIASVVGLLLIPLLTYGSGQDFCMRASIPLMFIIMVYTIDYLSNTMNLQPDMSVQPRQRTVIARKTIPLIIILIIGAATPITEYRESYLQYANSDRHCTSIFADKFGTLDNRNMERSNFITMNSTDTFFYKYLAKGEKK